MSLALLVTTDSFVQFVHTEDPAVDPHNPKWSGWIKATDATCKKGATLVTMGPLNGEQRLNHQFTNGVPARVYLSCDYGIQKVEEDGKELRAGPWCRNILPNWAMQIHFTVKALTLGETLPAYEIDEDEPAAEEAVNGETDGFPATTASA